MSQPRRRRRVLFVCEAVTLAQVVRLATLSRALDRARYQVHFASAHFDPMIFGASGSVARPLAATLASASTSAGASAPGPGEPVLVRHRIRSLSARTIDARVASGRRLYGRSILARYVAEERALLAEVRPDLVVGDLRLSLSISGALEKIPYANLINAYWSPSVTRLGFPMPDHPIVRLLGVELAGRYFPRALPFVFRHFAGPVNALREQHGLPSLGDLPHVLTHGDHTLYPDVPLLVPTRALPSHHRYLGPVLWSPGLALPSWWDKLDPGRPTVYVTLGSSGRVQRLRLIVDVASELGLQVIVATAGRAPRLMGEGAAVPRHVFVTDYLPGHLAARRAQIVVSNGGSTTGYQALAEGRPVLGIAFNLDQYLAMTAIEDAGAGLLVRAGNLDRDRLRVALQRMLSEPSFAGEAARLAREFARWNAREAFAAFVDETLGVPVPTA